MDKLNLIRLADVKAYISLLDREEITMSRFAEILNECANEALLIHSVVGQSEQLQCDGCGIVNKKGTKFFLCKKCKEKRY